MEMQDNRGDLGQVRLSMELRTRSRELCNRAAREIERSKEAKALFSKNSKEKPSLGRQSNRKRGRTSSVLGRNLIS